MTPAPRPILVIDDDRDVLTMLGIALERFGYQPLLVTTARAARHLLITTPVIAILIDFGVSVEDSHALITHIQHGVTPPAVILMSGHSWEHLADQIVAVPIAAFLPKPFAILSVSAILAHCLSPDSSIDPPAMTG